MEEAPPEVQEAVTEALEAKPEPPKPKRVSRLPKKETPPPPPPEPSEEEESEEEAPPTIVIHKKHKKPKPRKIIVITADESDVNTDDEEMPQRPRPEVTIKSAPKATKAVKVVAPPPAKPAKVAPPVEEEDNVKVKAPPKPTPAPKPAKPVKTDEGKIVGEKPNPRLQQAQQQSVLAQKTEAQKKSLTGDAWLDALFQL